MSLRTREKKDPELSFRLNDSSVAAAQDDFLGGLP